MKKIEIELTDAQAAIIENIANSLRSTREDAAKAYLMEGIRLLTEPGFGKRDSIVSAGLECVRTYIDEGQTPESVFASRDSTGPADASDQLRARFLEQDFDGIADKALSGLQPSELEIIRRRASELGQTLREHVLHCAKQKSQEILAGAVH
jgi:hypothetical protein